MKLKQNFCIIFDYEMYANLKDFGTHVIDFYFVYYYYYYYY